MSLSCDDEKRRPREQRLEPLVGAIVDDEREIPLKVRNLPLHLADGVVGAKLRREHLIDRDLKAQYPRPFATTILRCGPEVSK
jgi:hypothetical protein